MCAEWRALGLNVDYLVLGLNDFIFFQYTGKVSQKTFTRLLGCEIKHLRAIFKTNIFMYHSIANLDGKICLVKSLISKKQTLGKCW